MDELNNKPIFASNPIFYSKCQGDSTDYIKTYRDEIDVVYGITSRQSTNKYKSEFKSDPFDAASYTTKGKYLDFLKDPKIKTLLKARWIDFRKNKFNDLMAFINDYAFVIEDARNRDYQKWKRGGADFKTDINSLKTWMQNRGNYLDGYIGGL